MRHLKDIARQINSLPITLTIKHQYPIGTGYNDLDSAEGWDQVRLNHPHFVIPDNRQQWLSSLLLQKDGQDKRLPERAEIIVKQLHKHEVEQIHSVGCGTAALEFFIKQSAPELRLTASDYNLRGVERLKQVFIECDQIKTFDLLKDRFNQGEAVLMYRVDPHLTDQQWREIFLKLHTEGVKYVFYIPSDFLTIRKLYTRIRRAAEAKIKRKHTVFAGYLRTQTTFEKYWSGLYEVEIVNAANMPLYILTTIPKK